MKGVYRLIGVFWDGRPEADGCTAVLPYDPHYLPLSSQPCLFDFIERKRRVELSRVLAIESREEFGLLAEELAQCHSIAVVLDYVPQAKSSVHRRFFEHRVLQVLKSLSDALPVAEIIIMEPRQTEEIA